MLFKRITGWILSKIFPFRGGESFDDTPAVLRNWDIAKQKESQEYYGGHDGTTWRFEK